MDTASLVLGLRVLLSLACVLGLIWYANRRLSGSAATRRQRAHLSVVARQSLGGKASLALVDVGGRRLVLGVSENGVNLLTEVEPAPDPEPTSRSESRESLDPHTLPGLTDDDAPRTDATPTPRSSLHGSVLAPATWRQAVAAVQERTTRR